MENIIRTFDGNEAAIPVIDGLDSVRDISDGFSHQDIVARFPEVVIQP